MGGESNNPRHQAQSGWAGGPYAGLYTIAMLRQYLWFIMVAFIATLAVITSIDISAEIRPIWLQYSGTETIVAITRIARFIYLRILDNSSQIFGISFLLGLLWGEVSHVASGRLLAMRSVGLSFNARLLPVVILSVAASLVQFGLSSVIRPYAYMALSVENLGEYGRDFAQSRNQDFVWLGFGNDVLQARIKDQPAPYFWDAVYYRFGTSGQLLDFTSAGTMTQTPGMINHWHLKAASTWHLAKASMENGLPDRSATASRHETLTFPHQISEIWIRYRGIDPRYIPHTDLATLASSTALPDAQPDYHAWQVSRVFHAIDIGLTGIVAMIVFALVLDAMGLAVALLSGLICTYFGYLAIKALGVTTVSGIAAPVMVSFVFSGVLLGLAILLGKWRGQPDRATR